MQAAEIVTRAEQPYVAVSARVAMAELGGLAARFGEVFGWLGARGLEAADAPFFKYDLVPTRPESWKSRQACRSGRRRGR